MNSIKKLLFSVTGIVSVILSIVCYSLDAGSLQGNIQYGGDAYTGIQNAAAQTARNVKYLAVIAKFGFGSVLMITGILLILFALFCCSKAPAAQVPYNPPVRNTYVGYTSPTPVVKPVEDKPVETAAAAAPADKAASEQSNGAPALSSSDDSGEGQAEKQ